ncbi:hypothetical protein ASG17_12660 [Brevundimonas sp. Leaf363]|uniref:hypothetical protein n=1 Tax=Brevundimonas sp. Leaf363 TaxID=1736353 RepID=UPI0006F428D9|nr:hypothetical protein [Brevundimonas sp. Leaf363]KQS53813.1 hypothetical protein ASG17_12660 [Brevundimonas sp. Leaf363]
MKFAPIFAALALTTIGASAAFAQTPAPAPAAQAAAVSVETTPIDELLQNPAAMEIVYRHFPDMKGQEDQLAMAGSMTLRDVQAYAADTFTDDKLAALDADLKAMGH